MSGMENSWKERDLWLKKELSFSHIVFLENRKAVIWYILSSINKCALKTCQEKYKEMKYTLIYGAEYISSRVISFYHTTSSLNDKAFEIC